MPRTDYTWAEYTADPEPRIVRVFSNEVEALRSAVAEAHRVVRLPYGVTLADALEAANPSTVDAGPRVDRGPTVPGTRRTPRPTVPESAVFANPEVVD